MTAASYLCDRLGLERPVIQAPMAGVQGSALAVAVSEAGGLGSLPCAMLDAEGMRREIAAIRASTRRPYAVNFFCHRSPAPDSARDRAWRRTLAPYYAEYALGDEASTAAPTRVPFGPEAADVLDELEPPVVSFHFGLPPADLLRRLQRWRPAILSTATTVAEARWLEAHGVTAVVAQGLEAGGHRGHFLSEDLSLQADAGVLLREIVGAVRVPVIAAGGIADADGVAAALALGAAAVQVGTAYLLCPEATTSRVHREAITALRAAADPHTAVTNLFTGRPARGIVNRLMREMGPMRPDVPAFPLAAGALAPLRAAAERFGRGDFSPLWAGQRASACREAPAAELTRALSPSLG